MTCRITRSALWVGLLSVAATANATPEYHIEDLGVVRTWTYSNGFGISSNGNVAGRVSDGSKSRAVRWDPVNGMEAISTLGGDNAFGFGINAAGTVVGNSDYDANGFFSHAFRQTLGGAVEDLGTFGGHNSDARGINDAGVIAGAASMGDQQPRAFIWKEGIGLIDIGTITGSGTSVANAINQGGQVTGNSVAGVNITHAFRYTEGFGMLDLGTLDGSTLLNGNGLNESGDVVGEYSIGSKARAFYFKDGVGLTKLDGLIDFDTRAQGVNDSGIAVGTSSIDLDSHYKAVVWKGGGALDLNDLIDETGWNLQEAWNINAAGQIVGTGIIDGNAHAFRLTPVPEPASFVALGLGVGFFVRRPRK